MPIPFLPFQLEAVDFCKKAKRTLVNLPAGAGKSLIALETVKDLDRVLIVCPGFLRLNWWYEMQKWFPSNWHIETILYSKEDALEILVVQSAVFAIAGYEYFQKSEHCKLIGRQH